MKSLTNNKLTDEQINYLFMGKEMEFVNTNSNKVIKLKRVGNTQEIGIYTMSVSRRWIKVGENEVKHFGFSIYNECTPFWKIK